MWIKIHKPEDEKQLKCPLCSFDFNFLIKFIKMLKTPFMSNFYIR